MEASRDARPRAAARRWSRRQTFRYAAAAVGAAASSGLLRSPAFAAASTANPVEVVYFQINWQQSWDNVAINLCQQYTDANFNSRHKGVRAIPQPWGNASGVLGQVLAGVSTAPAVVSSCCGDFAVALPMLARLDPLLQQDNLPRSLWSQGQLITYQEPDGLYGVPAYTACQPLIYNQTLFDDLGLKYPDAEWDYTEATSIWRSIAGKLPNGNWRYGTTMQWYPNSFDGGVYLLKGFGGELMDATHTRCLIDSPPAISAGNWIYPLIWDKVIINRGGVSGYNGAGAVVAGLVGMYQSAGNMLFEAVEEIGNKLNWDVLPMPRWPVRRGTNVQVDYYGLNKYYPNQELAWELWKFVAAGQGTNRFLISSTLSFPNLMSMWPEWEALVRAAAPVTRDKALHWWADAATQGYGYGHEFWKYEDAQAESAMGTIMQQLWDHKMDATAGFTEMKLQVDAIEATGQKTTAALLSAEALQAKLLKSVAVGPSTRYPAPPIDGVGVAPTPANALVRSGPAGTFTLLGDGWGLGGTSGAYVLACDPLTATEGAWSCRVVAIANLTCPHLSQWSKVGIGAFGDLSDDPVFVSAHVTGANQIEWQSRFVPNLSVSGTAGLLPAGVTNLTAPNTKPAANYLLKPVWLRISRSGEMWTPWASLDGAHWSQLSAPAPVSMAGCWIGVMACARNTGFSDEGYIRATFDNLSFTPSRFVQVGRRGTPPAAGPVPKDWVTANA